MYRLICSEEIKIQVQKERKADNSLDDLLEEDEPEGPHQQESDRTNITRGMAEEMIETIERLAASNERLRKTCVRIQEGCDKERQEYAELLNRLKEAM